MNLRDLGSRALNRIGLHTPGQVRDLSERLAALETKARFMGPESSGVEMSFGRFEYEKNAALRGAKKWETLDEMSVDPAVHEAMYLPELQVISAHWNIESGADTPIAKEAAELQAANLLRLPSDRFGREYWCQTSWQAQRLPEILDMRRSGFSMFCKSTREVDGKLVYDRLQWLEPRTVDPSGWQLSRTDDIELVKRTYSNPKDEAFFWKELEAFRLALYVWELRGARFEGRGANRSMYSAWFRKVMRQKLGVTRTQKLGSPIPIVNAPHDATPADMIKAHKLAQQARGTSPTDAYFVGKRNSDGQGYELTYPGPTPGEADMIEAGVTSDNMEILRGGLQGSRMLGETQSGSRALGESKSAPETLATQAIAITVCEFENHGVANLPGLIQESHAWNYGPRVPQPMLCCTKISPYEGLEHVDTLVKAWSAKLHPELLQKITEAAGYTLSEGAYEVQGADPLDETGGDPEDTEEEADDEIDDQAKAAAIAADAVSLKAKLRELLEPDGDGPTPTTMRRRPNKMESRYLRLSEVLKSFEDGETRTRSPALKSRQRMIEDMVDRIASERLQQRSIESHERSNPKGLSSMVDEIMAAVERSTREGQGHIRDELGRMRK